LTVGQRPLDGSFVARRLARCEVILCASPDYLDRRGRPSHPDDLAEHESMMPSSVREVTFTPGPFGCDEPSGEPVTLSTPRPALGTAHSDTMYAAALHGLGIAGLPSFMVEDALLENALERVPPEWHLFAMTIYAAMPTRKY